MDNLENLLRKAKLSAALLPYPKLWMHPTRLKNAKKDYDLIKADNGEIEQLYKTLSYDLTNDDKSNIRHPYTNAKFVRKDSSDFVDDLGKYKEFVDALDNKPWDDTKSDLINNEYGINLGLRYPDAPDVFLFDNVLQHSNLPVPARNNTIYGYIDNLPDNNQDLQNLNKQYKSQLYNYLINPIEKYDK